MMMAICAAEVKSNFFVGCAAGEPDKFGAFVEEQERCKRDARNRRVVTVERRMHSAPP